MICSTCQSSVSRIKIVRGVESCSACSGFSEVSSVAVDGLNSRNSLRVRSESVKREGDTILPHAYDKARRDVGVNADFIRLHPDKALNFYTQSELKKAGYAKLGVKVAKDEAKKAAHKEAIHKSVSFEGNASKAQQNLLK